MTRCIAILALALTSTLFADQSSAADGWSGDIKDGTYWEVLLDMGYSPEEADCILVIADEFWHVHFEVVVDTIGSGGTFTLSDNQSGFSPDYILLLDMGFSPEEADYIQIEVIHASRIENVSVPFHLGFEMGDHRY